MINFLFKIIILTFLFYHNTFGQNSFELDEQRSTVLQNIIASDIGVADLNNDGINDIILYGYNKIGNQDKHVGVIAQEVEKVYPEAVTDPDLGFKAVNYEMLGLEMKELV